MLTRGVPVAAVWDREFGVVGDGHVSVTVPSVSALVAACLDVLSHQQERITRDMSYACEKQVAVEAVTRAAKLCAAVRAQMVRSDSAAFLQKDDRSPVTVADYGAQTLVCQHLSDAFPYDAIVAEEDAAILRRRENAEVLDQVTYFVRRWLPGATRRDICDLVDLGGGRPAQRFWTLDPIDGTKGFLRNDQYAVALALIVGGQVVLGVLACPALSPNLHTSAEDSGVLFVAVRGEGVEMASLNGGAGTPVQVTTAASGLRLVESVEVGHGNHELQELVAGATGIDQPPLRMDSQAKYGAVARGDAALYLRLPSLRSPDYREQIWDHAAGTIIVEEAGGRVSDMHGMPLDFSVGTRLHANRGVVVSNGVLHDGVVSALAAQPV
jgi:3'(2'), 5'-bisphosphate nucleotidase